MLFVGTLVIVAVLAESLGTSGQALSENDTCLERPYGKWTCKPRGRCPTSSSLTLDARCKQERGKRMVCCPPVEHKSAKSYCEKLIENCHHSEGLDSSVVFNVERYVRTMQDVLPEGFIAGGKVAEPKKFPYMAMVGYGEDKDWLCGGSLINERFVLSAAHCSKHNKLGPPKWIRLGDLDYSRADEPSDPQDFEITEIIDHDDYKEPELYNDIALYKLDKEARFNDFVQPLCLHTKARVPVKNAVVTGWGRTGFVSDLSSILLEVTLPMINNSYCNELRGNTTQRVPKGILAESQICTATSESGMDACQGDSGSPLVIEISDHCVFTQIGITSFGTNCGLANTPGIFTRVSHYLPWIEDKAFN